MAIFICVKTDFLKWLFNARMIIIAALAVFIYVCAVQPLASNSAIMGKPLNALEPYIAALISGSLLLMIPLGFLVISSDFPKIDGSSMFCMVRTGKTVWFFWTDRKSHDDRRGVSAFYICRKRTSLVIWQLMGRGMERCGSALPDRIFGIFTKFRRTFASEKSVQSSVAANCCAAKHTVRFCLSDIARNDHDVFYDTRKKALGVIICGGLIAVGSALCSIRAGLMWAFPMANSIVWLHYTEFRRVPFYPIWCSVIYFTATIAVLAVLGFIMLKRFDCSTNDSEEKQL